MEKTLLDPDKDTSEFLKDGCNVCLRWIQKYHMKPGMLSSNRESTGFVTIATQKGQPEGFQA
jgi:hypothetical protein